MINVLKLKSAIIEAGYTQETLSKELNMSPNTFSAKINGKSKFNIDEIYRICKILNINTNEKKVSIFLSDTSQNRDDTDTK